MEKGPLIDTYYEEEPKPEILIDNPELEAAWKGLVVSIRHKQMTREKAETMLNEWAEEQKHINSR